MNKLYFGIVTIILTMIELTTTKTVGQTSFVINSNMWFSFTHMQACLKKKIQ